MTSKFESIFNDKNATDDKTNLNKLFSRKAVSKPVTTSIEPKDSNETITIDNSSEIKSKPKKLNPEYESRTVFVGNLNVGCKKEVN